MSTPLPHALVVSIHSTKIAIVKRALQGLYHVIAAESSFSALDWLRHEPIQLIILDQKSLSSEWSSLCAHIRSLPGYDKIPILLISSNHKKTFYLEALHHGITDFIGEPLDSAEVSERVLIASQAQPLNKKMALVSKKFSKKTAASSIQPPLTKRLIITEALFKKISDAVHTQHPLCLLMLEIDQWHKMERGLSEREIRGLNTQIETFLKKQLREQDLLLSQGGSQFLILLPKTSHRAGVLIAENLRIDAHKEVFKLKGDDLFLTFSIGCSAYDNKTPLKETTYEHFEKLLTKVAQSLKKAQRKKNRIITDKE